jgi:replicative DNA helicase
MATMNFKQDVGVVSWFDSWDDEKHSRQTIDIKKVCTFGIKPLDDALIGILKNDLIVIGADSGVGKSELVLDIAMHNAKNGKKVALYYIEGNDNEAIARIKWKLIKDQYYSGGYTGVDMDYRKWRMNMLKGTCLDEIEDTCRNNLTRSILDNLQFYRVNSGFTVSCLQNSLGYFLRDTVNEEYKIMVKEMDVDLIIIDHLQYFTLTNPKNEFQEMTEILKIVKEITDIHQIPVILVSHLRKKDKERGLPGQEDFYGTSNIAKIASQAITITPSYTENAQEGRFPTFFRFAKSRTGLKPHLAVLAHYNANKGHYENEYDIFKLKGGFPDASPLEYSQWPSWAKKKSVCEHKMLGRPFDFFPTTP